MNRDEPQTIQQQPLTSITGPVTIPLLQAVITGAGAGLIALVLLLWAGAPFWLPAWFLVTVGGFLSSWLSYRGRWQWIIEKVLMTDLNNDGYIGPPAPARSIRVELSQNQGRQVDYIDLPYPDKQPVLASGLLAGDPFSMRKWAQDTNVFSQNEFRQVQDVYIRRGLARWKSDDHRQGAELTPAGRAMCRRLASDTPLLPHFPGEDRE